MNNELSAFLDGEAEEHEIDSLFAAMRTDGELRRQSAVFCLIGDALRDEDHLECDMLAGVMRAVAEGPVVVAPRARPRSALRPMLAMAASAAGVAVVGWLAIAPRLDEPALPVLARHEVVLPKPAALAAAQVAANDQMMRSNMQEYLVAHQASVSGLQVPSPAGHIRPVSAVGRE